MKNEFLKNVFSNGGKVKSTNKNPYLNSENYPDPTAYHGLKKVIKEEELMERQVSDIVHVVKVICNLAGFEVIGRIQFRHKKSGKDFK